jgi:hypothetical protein
MTLKEKFKQWLDTDPRLQIREVQLEVIAEEFAIGFADWISEQPEVKIIKKSGLDNCYIKMTSKELLKIYKEEKGL